MNKTVMAVGYFALVLVVLVVVSLIALFAPDQFDRFVTFAGITLSSALGAVVTIYMLTKQNVAIEAVKKQTNGANSELRAKVDELTQQLLSVVGNAPGAGTPAVPPAEEAEWPDGKGAHRA